MAFKFRAVEILVECFWGVFRPLNFHIHSLFYHVAILCVEHSFLIELEVLLEKKNKQFLGRNFIPVMSFWKAEKDILFIIVFFSSLKESYSTPSMF